MGTQVDWAAQPAKMLDKLAQEQAIRESLPAPICHHCQKKIEHDGTDSWRHVNGFYTCFEGGGWNQATPESDL